MPTAFQVLCMSSSSESTSGSSLSSSLSTSSSSGTSSQPSGKDSDLSNELWLSTAHTELQLTCFTVNYSKTDTDSSDEESNRLSDTSSVSDSDADILTSSHNQHLHHHVQKELSSMFSSCYKTPQKTKPKPPSQLPFLLHITKHNEPAEFWEILRVTPYTFDQLLA
ncbi:hypothetical protein GYMLUDRAFT_65010 [Collybiopsis luxurians FD-317 M1]|uniref:Uncharacterized protein n=1 Tax=Collybiopsis luxurians FD-317 M1 TaxID=944289 RepID=A0A0D0ALL9_9AGAR|nr:hypothetical protein GYMLUDRAFT_65010 [Collybiopsis luxurians FD-317 M1]